MTQVTSSPEQAQAGGAKKPLHVAPGPHLFDRSLTTRRMMIDVLIGLAPVVLWSLYNFQMYAAGTLVLCVGSCVAAEWLFMKMRGRKPQLGDFSAVVTGVILAMSLPAVAGASGWYVSVLGGFVAIGLGKVIFGSLGQNIFNPAMVGRAFVVLAFTGLLGASTGGYVQPDASVDVVTRATPLTVLKAESAGLEAPDPVDMTVGTINGSLGEVNAIACLLGGLYLLIRRTASWQIPVGIIATVVVVAGFAQLIGGLGQATVYDHVAGGAMLFGAFFIATDPVSSPLTHRGKWIFGIGVGLLIMLIRLLSSYPEGVMFSVLLMNAVVPLINRWTIPKPVGGPVPVRK
ncbi:MAG: RnfABCDGE type electron transport complex subunit D [Planctomycetota bacterium]